MVKSLFTAFHFGFKTLKSARQIFLLSLMVWRNNFISLIFSKNFQVHFGAILPYCLIMHRSAELSEMIFLLAKKALHFMSRVFAWRTGCREVSQHLWFNFGKKLWCQSPLFLAIFWLNFVILPNYALDCDSVVLSTVKWVFFSSEKGVAFHVKSLGLENRM